MRSLLSATYFFEYFAANENKSNAITTINVRYYGPLLFDHFDIGHPFSETRGSYGLAKPQGGGYLLYNQWILLFRTWIAWAKNKFHQSFDKFV